MGYNAVTSCLYTAHNPATLGEMAALTLPNKFAYCQRHGYALHVEEWDGTGWPGFYRLAVLMHLLRCAYFDWVLWLGTDCLITNLSTKIESLADANYGLIVSADFTQIQLDSFLVQRERGGLALLEEVWRHRDHPIGKWEEQSTLAAIAPDGVVKVLPQRAMNSFDHRYYPNWPYGRQRIEAGIDCNGHDGRWQPGDFVFHCPGLDYGTKMAALREKLPQVKG